MDGHRERGHDRHSEAGSEQRGDEDGKRKATEEAGGRAKKSCTPPREEEMPAPARMFVAIRKLTPIRCGRRWLITMDWM